MHKYNQQSTLSMAIGVEFSLVGLGGACDVLAGGKHMLISRTEQKECDG